MVQTEAFARLLQERLVGTRLDDREISLGFKNLEISLFPLETKVTKVGFALPRQGVEGTFGSISFRVDFSDLLLNRLTISEMRARGGMLSVRRGRHEEEGGRHPPVYAVPERDVREGSTDGSGFFVVNRGLEDIDRIVSQLPFRVGRIAFNDAHFRTDYLDGLVKNIEFTYNGSRKDIDIRGECEDVKLNEDYGWKGDVKRIKLFASANPHRVILKNFFAQIGANDISTQGNFLIADRSYEGDVQGKLSLNSLAQYVPLEHRAIFQSIEDGELRFDGSVSMKDGLVFDSKLLVRGFRSSYGRFGSMDAHISFIDSRLSVKKVDITTEGGGKLLVEDEVYYDVKDKRHNLTDVLVRLERVKTGEALAFLGDNLEPLDSTLTGFLEFSLYDENILRFDLRDGFWLEQTNLVFGNFKILSFDRLGLEGTYFQYDLEAGIFTLESRLSLGKERLLAQGYVSRDSVDIGFKKGEIDLNFVNNIAGVRIGGAAQLDFSVTGPFDDVKINAFGRGDEIVVDKYAIGNGDFQLIYHIKTKALQIKEFKSQDIDSRFSGKGWFDFSRTKKNSMELDLDVEKMSYLAIKRSIGFHLPKLIRGIEGLNFLFSGKAVLKLDFWKGVDHILIDSNLSSVTYLGETIPVGRFELSIDNKNVHIKNAYLQKGRGGATGSFLYDLQKNNIEYSFRIRDVNLDSFYFYRRASMGLTGKIDGFIQGKGYLGSVVSDGSLKVNNARVANREVVGPRVTARLNAGGASVEWDVLGDKLKGSAHLDFRNTQESSKIKMDVAIDDLQTFFAILFKHNADGDFGGSLYAKLDTSFSFKDPLKLDLEMEVSDFHLDYKNKKIDLSNNNAGIKIVDGRIENWDIEANGEASALSSSGKGSFVGGFEIANNYTLDPTILGIFFNDIIGAEGRIVGETKVLGHKENVRFFSRLSTRAVSFSHKKVPGAFEDVTFDIVANDDNITINKASGRYGRGNFNVNGKVEIGFPHPVVDIELGFENINYAVFSKSNVIASGKVGLAGANPPYVLNGRIVVDKLLFLDSLTELTKGVNQSYVYSKYLPKKDVGSSDGWINFDIGISGKDSIEIKTNIVNAVLSSSLSVKGGLAAPLYTGRASIAPKISRIFFKGQEFVIERGRVDFRDFSGKQAPFIQLEGSSAVDRYKVLLSIVGNTDNLVIDLQSEPALTQKDILSLMTFGYTSDDSANLDESQRQFLTTMSLGGFLIDQLRIGQGLNDRVGFRLSVAPEFDEDEENLIANRTSDTRHVRRLKSSTKVTLESNIGKKTNVSISSSLGAEDEQAQGLKVNYNINESFSVQGVYENIMEDNQAQQTNSFGGDLKFQWIFGE